MAQLEIRRQQGFRLAERLLRLDWFLVALVCTIGAVGIGMLISAAGGSTEPWASRQMVWFGAGLLVMLAVAVIDIGFWLRAAYTIYGLAFALLVGVEPAGRGGDGRAALDRSRRGPTAAVGTDEDRAGAGACALFPRHRTGRARPHPHLRPSGPHDPRARRADPAPAGSGDRAVARALRRNHAVPGWAQGVEDRSRHRHRTRLGADRLAVPARVSALAHSHVLRSGGRPARRGISHPAVEDCARLRRPVRQGVSPGHPKPPQFPAGEADRFHLHDDGGRAGISSA